MLMVCYIIIIGLLFCIGYIKHKNIFSPICMFCGLWLFIGILASLKLYQFEGYTDVALVAVLIGNVFFVVGNVWGGKIKIKIKKDNRGLKLNHAFLIVILALVSMGSIVSLWYIIRAFFYGMSYVEIRGSLLRYNDIQVIDNQFIEGFVNYFCGPAKTMLLPLAIMYLFQKKHKLFRRLVFINVIAGIVSSGGRIVFLYAIIQVLATAGYYNIRISKKAKKYIKRAVAVMLCAVIILTNLRTTSGVWFSLYSYFSIPLALLSKYISLVDDNFFYGYGGATFYPFFYIANSISDMLGMDSQYLQDLVYYVGLPQNKWIELFPGRTYNAFCSLFYFFYLDFRMVGVAVISLLYGLLTGIVYKQAYHERKENAFYFYLMLLQTLFGSFMIWQLGNTKFFVSMFLYGVACLIAHVKIKISGKSVET